MSRRLRNTTGKGIEFELLVQRDLEAREMIVGQRRHVPGPGDFLAVDRHDGTVWLVEAKAGKETFGAGFRRSEREAMRAFPLPPGGMRMLAKPGTATGTVRYIPESAWPL